jgi:hypothetical protein
VVETFYGIGGVRIPLAKDWTSPNPGIRQSLNLTTGVTESFGYYPNGYQGERSFFLSRTLPMRSGRHRR